MLCTVCASSIYAGREQAQGTVRPDMIIIMSPVVDHHPSFAQCVDYFPIQALPPKPAVKTLRIAVLPWASRFNVDRLDPVILKPLLDNLGNKLRAVVTPNELWSSMLLNAFFQYPQDIRSSQRTVGVQRMAFPCVFID